MEEKLANVRLARPTVAAMTAPYAALIFAFKEARVAKGFNAAMMGL
jgi:hypothetical protein